MSHSPKRFSNRYWWNIARFAGLFLAVLVLLGLGWLGKAIDTLVTNAVHPPRQPLDRTPAEDGLTDFKSVAFSTTDRLKLRGWYIPSQNGAAIILGHGHAGNRVAMLPEASILASHGYGVLLFDWRAHGESDGDITTFGKDEVYDLTAAVNYVEAQPDVDPHRIGALGFSLGGATIALEAPGDPRLRAIVVEGAYASFGDTVRHRTRDLPLVGQFATLWGSIRTGVDADAIRPVDTICAFSPRPVLFIYGSQDTYVPPGSAQQMFEAACGPKELWVIEGVGHGGYAAGAPEAYEQRIVGFFDEALQDWE
jgi:fermentation-respiration switch protein FrsA (DUF1100 family)